MPKLRNRQEKRYLILTCKQKENLKVMISKMKCYYFNVGTSILAVDFGTQVITSIEQDNLVSKTFKELEELYVSLIDVSLMYKPLVLVAYQELVLLNIKILDKYEKLTEREFYYEKSKRISCKVLELNVNKREIRNVNYGILLLHASLNDYYLIFSNKKDKWIVAYRYSSDTENWRHASFYDNKDDAVRVFSARSKYNEYTRRVLNERIEQPVISSFKKC